MLIHLMRATKLKRERTELLQWLSRSRNERTLAEVPRDLLKRLTDMGSIEHARLVAARHAAHAMKLFDDTLRFIPESEDKAILRQVIHYVNTRML